MKCMNCKHVIAGISEHNNARSSWWCRLERTECQPYRRIAQAKGNVFPLKMAPRWCPLKDEKNLCRHRVERSIYD